MVNEVMDVWQICLISKAKKNAVFNSIIDYDDCYTHSTEWLEFYLKKIWSLTSLNMCRQE